jgi:hypothetical protein
VVCVDLKGEGRRLWCDGNEVVLSLVPKEDKVKDDRVQAWMVGWMDGCRLLHAIKVRKDGGYVSRDRGGGSDKI